MSDPEPDVEVEDESQEPPRCLYAFSGGPCYRPRYHEGLHSKHWSET